ncbi:MAG: hypothetical protein H6R25_4419 [Proteobacteria bacterium]|nr:hypothetical protein [Pseudomonadota bacterium]
MFDYFRTFKEAFGWQRKLGLRALLIFIGKSFLAYVFLVGFYLVGLRLVLLTPVMDYLTTDKVVETTLDTMLGFRLVVLIPVVMHVVKTRYGELSSPGAESREEYI